MGPLVVGAVVFLISHAVFAQPKPQASATPSVQSSARPAPVLASSGDAMPPGHPPIEQGMPAGHPPVGGDGDEEPGQEMDSRFFRPPQDTVVDDPSLPAGVIVVIVKDAQNNPIPRAPMMLGVVHSTVAKGESRDTKSAVGDDQGAARFEELVVGSGHTYRVATTRGTASYALMPFSLGDRGGKRVVLHAYEASSNVEGLAVGLQGLVYLTLREDSIQVEQLISVFNLGPVSWTPDVTFDLPLGFKAFNKQEGAGDGRVDEVAGRGAALRGTFPPGRQDLDFRYQVPLDNEASQTLRIRMPPQMAQARVLLEASKTMALKVRGFPEARAEKREGKRLLFTEQQANRADGGVRELEIELSGLPTPGNGRWVALVCAMFAVLGGAYALWDQREGGADHDTRQEMVEARDALLDELVVLERALKNNEIGPKTHARVRASLMDALARIMSMLDSMEPSARPKYLRRGRRKAQPA